MLTLRQQMQRHQHLTRGEALRELLHDGHKGFLGFDPISPVKPHLGQDFHDVANRLQQVINARYDLPPGAETTTFCTRAPIGSRPHPKPSTSSDGIRPSSARR